MRQYTNGDSSIHLCYNSDNFYRYKGYPYPYTEKTTEFWDIVSGTWANGGSTMAQYGYMTNTGGGELSSNTEYVSAGIYSRMKSVSPTGRTATLTFRADITTPFNRYYIRQYTTLTNGHSIEIVKNISSTETIIAYSVDSTFLDSGLVKEMTIVEDAGNIRLWIGNKPVIWNNGLYYINDSSASSGAFGLKNDNTTAQSRFYNTAIFECATATKKDLWNDFILSDYTISGDTKTGAVRIPGKIGGHIQSGSPDARNITITGRLMSNLTDAKEFDELIERFIANELPVFIHTPAIKVSGMITSYSPPKPKKGTRDIYSDFQIQLVENWFYEV